MKRFPLFVFIAMACLLVNLSVARAAGAPKPTASFEVGTTHVDKYGTGEPTLILIPGLTDTAAVWAGTIEHFAPMHTVYALTLGGFGGRPAAKAPLIDKADADIVTLIAREHLNKPVVIGHSLGGHIAIRFATEHSDLVRGALAVDGLPIYPGYETMTPVQRETAATRMTSQMSAAPPAQFDMFEKQYIIPYLTQAKNVDAVAAAGAGADPVATGEYMQELLTTDLRPGLAKINVPLLVLAPFDDTLDPKNPNAPFATAAAKKTYYESLLENDKAAKVQVIEHSRHFIMYDQPDALYTALETFLKSLP